MVKGKVQHAGRKNSLGFALPLPQLATAPKLVEEVWVQCDRPDCKKWRKLPPGSKAPPDNVEWFCSLNPDPYRQSCDIPEEDYSDDDWEAREQQQKQHSIQQPQFAAAVKQQLPSNETLRQLQQQQQQQHPPLYQLQRQQPQLHQQQQQQHHHQHQQPEPLSSRRRKSGELYSDYDWGFKKKRRKSAGPPQQLPRFFATREEELQQLEVACRRILGNGGVWDSSAALQPPPPAAAAAAVPSPSPGQLALPLWVWNGLHTFAPQAAALLVDVLDKLTSCISLDMQDVLLPLPSREQPQPPQPPQQQELPEQSVTLQDSLQQQQQLADGSEPSAAAADEQKQQQPEPLEAGNGEHPAAAVPDQQQQQQQHVLPEVKLSVVEQRWRFAQMTLLVAAAATLVALGKDPDCTSADGSVAAKAEVVGALADGQQFLQQQQPQSQPLWQQHEPLQQQLMQQQQGLQQQQDLEVSQTHASTEQQDQGHYQDNDIKHRERQLVV